MAINRTITSIGVDDSTDNGKVPAYNSTTKVFEMTTPGGGGIDLETDGTPNGDQTLLNLVAGTNITLTDNGTGSVTIDASGGGGGTKEYAFITMSGGQSANLSTGNHIELDTISYQIGTGITLATGSGQSDGIITLPAGKTFELIASTSIAFTGTGGYATIGFYDRTHSTVIGFPSYFQLDLVSMVGNAMAVITTSGSTNIDLRLLDVGSIDEIFGGTSAGGSGIIIREL